MDKQKDTDKKAIDKKMAVSNNARGGKSAMSKMNPQKPDQKPFNAPVFKGIRMHHGG
jgi:hypothetical protein